MGGQAAHRASVHMSEHTHGQAGRRGRELNGRTSPWAPSPSIESSTHEVRRPRPVQPLDGALPSVGSEGAGAAEVERRRLLLRAACADRSEGSHARVAFPSPPPMGGCEVGEPRGAVDAGCGCVVVLQKIGFWGEGLAREYQRSWARVG